ncbi:hypothetical protein J7443_22835 [Tropicibacter sp. R15_0]|uniref:WcbI family polysaccharide biosynthesis putative acetyltransferase n=1 Tax=Tropicibacter sp. R15_0 TaxID=2821101 RepID=UPI001ADD508C|nr:WcbI family polysaccharide biosynthesis putative acetyltransferase [Tropicibacter sp. R15_0]MBO9468081.1 hypothetical protein [Tropicibacter sp. R15_0]
MQRVSSAPNKIFVLFNCQNRMLIQALQRLLPDSEVTGMSTHLFSLRQERGEIDSKVAADAFVFLPNGPTILGHHPSSELLPDVEPIMLNPIIFRGFHPDAVAVRKEQNGTALLAGLHSQIVHRGYERGLSETEIAADFNEHTYRELGYFEMFQAEQKRLLAGFVDQGLEMGAAYNSWMRSSIFMRTTNHPKPHVIFDLAVALCKREGWAFDPARARYWRPMAEDFLLNDTNWPVYPDLAEELGFEGSFFFRLSGQSDVLTLPEFIRHELAYFKESGVPA